MAEFKLLGGATCLDFANTVDWRKGEPRELLSSFNDLVDWARQAREVTDSEARELLSEAALDPGRGEALLRRAVALREAVYRVFKAHADGASPREDDLELLNRELADAHSHTRLAWEGDGYALRLQNAPEKIIWSVAHSAAQLLTGPHLGRVKECGDPRCGWLFLDTSRNGTRRWCSMSDCGNRNKARAHYRRRQTS
jgi:predicted RNA-binding Zn ribbon-like protein